MPAAATLLLLVTEKKESRCLFHLARFSWAAWTFSCSVQPRLTQKLMMLVRRIQAASTFLSQLSELSLTASRN